MPDQRGELRGKRKGAVLQGVIERLLAHPVAAAEQDAGLAVIQREGPHAIEPRRQIPSPLAVAMEQDFSIRMIALEPVPQFLEFPPQLGKVVDFAVEDDAEAAVPRPHRLAATSHVDDREAPVAEVDPPARVRPQTLRVRPSMDEGVGHAPEVLDRTPPDESGNAAHQSGLRVTLRVSLTR